MSTSVMSTESLAMRARPVGVLIMSAEAAYKRALSVNANYGPAYFNLALLYLDADPFPSGGGTLDTLLPCAGRLIGKNPFEITRSL